jgi:YegS/Rv2252/BmrU family lipid kinase
MSKTTVILNPTAGRGAGSQLAPQIEAHLRDQGLEFDLATTNAPDHAVHLAKEAVDLGHERLIAIGGDGTFNEVLNGLMQAGGTPDEAALGIVPIGTGNDMAYGADLPLEWQQACQIIAKGATRVLDVGHVQCDNDAALYFGNGVGIGFDAIVNMESRKLKRLRGFFLYFVALMKTLMAYYHAPVVAIDVDGETMNLSSLMVSIMNGQRFGGGFYMTPDAQMDDGLFDVCVTGKVARPKMVGFVPRFMRGTHVTDRRVTITQGRQIAVAIETPWAAHVDGEVYGVGAKRFEVGLIPKRLRLIG